MIVNITKTQYSPNCLEAFFFFIRAQFAEPGTMIRRRTTHHYNTTIYFMHMTEFAFKFKTANATRLSVWLNEHVRLRFEWVHNITLIRTRINIKAKAVTEVISMRITRSPGARDAFWDNLIFYECDNLHSADCKCLFYIIGPLKTKFSFDGL